MRVLQLIGSTGMYGAEAVVGTLARTLPSMGIHTHVCHVRHGRNSSSFRLEDRLNGVDVIPLEHRGPMDLGVTIHLRALMKRLNIDLIHSHGYKPDLYGGIAASLSHLPMLSTCHLWTRATRALRFYAGIDQLVLRAFDGVVAVSTPILEELRAAGISESKLSLIPNGISVERLVAGKPFFRTSFDKDSLLFGAACRQVSAKGIDVLLQAAARVLRRVPHARFLIAGDGPKLEEYRQLAQDLDLGSKVEFYGRCETMADFYASLDVFLLPSLDEGLPIALLEAMAAGLPSIATTVGSVNEAILHRKNGLLIPPGDVTALENAMLELAASREDRIRLGQAAREEVVARYTEERMVRRYVDLYLATAKGWPIDSKRC